MAMEQINKFPRVKLLIFAVFFFAVGHTAFAGTLRRPPNNLGLVAYWPLNEGGGSVAGDASGNGHTGTLAGTTVLPAWVSGKLGKALSFPIAANSDTKVTFAPIAVGATHTVSMWIYLTANCTSTYGDLFAQDTTNGLYCLRSNGANYLDYYNGFSFPFDNLNNTPLKLNQWYHVVVTSDGASTTAFYVNGIADGGISGSVITYNANTIGSDSLFEAFKGYIDEVRVYNRALSASEVYALYKSGAVQVNSSYKSPNTLSTGLTSYYTFDGKDMIQNVADVSGNGRNGRLTNYTSTTTVPGKVGQALTFNANNYVSTTASIANFMSSATGSISLWLRPIDGTSNFNSAASVYNAQPAVSCSCILGSFGISRGNKVDTGEDKIWVWKYSDALIGIPYVVGEWAYITLVHANGLLSAYKNGDFVGSATAGSFSNFSGNLYIGGIWSGSSARWKGDLDEVRTYSRDLSAAEIKQLYNLTLGTKVNKPSVNSLTSGLVGYYTFDGGDTDWSTNTITNRGSIDGTATLVNMSTTTSPVPGKVGQGFTFDGTNGYINLGASSSLKIGSGSYSVSLWYKGLKGIRESFFSTGATCCVAFDDIYSDGASVNNGSQSTNIAYTLPNNNDWHHLVVVLNRVPSPDTLETYIDGVSVGVATGALDGQAVANPTDSSYIGRNAWASGSSKRQGPMDEVRIYNRTLSAAEVLQLYRMGK